MTIEERLDKLEQERNVWRRIAVGLLLTGVVFGLLLTSAGSSGSTSRREQNRDDGRGTKAADGTAIHDRLRVRSLEILASDGSLVGIFESVGTGDKSRGHLELIGWRGAEWGSVTVRPTSLTICSEAGAVELAATSASWTARTPAGITLTEPAVRLGAREDGGFVEVRKANQGELASSAGDRQD